MVPTVLTKTVAGAVAVAVGVKVGVKVAVKVAVVVGVQVQGVWVKVGELVGTGVLAGA